MDLSKQFAVVLRYHDNCLCSNRDEAVATASTFEKAKGAAVSYVLQESDEEDCIIDGYISNIKKLGYSDIGDYCLKILDAADYSDDVDIDEGFWHISNPGSTRSESRRTEYK